jgi:GNAT superfamily N-acetyltransferase
LIVMTRLFVPADRDAVSRAMRAAFRDDPVFSYVLPDPGVRAKRLPGLFSFICDHALHRGVGFVAGEGLAASLWFPPGVAKESILDVAISAVPAIRATGSGIIRLLRVNEGNERHRPREPHWYLHLAGCDPSAQGQGLGGAIIRAGLARADDGGMPAYLETGKEANLALYRNFGFAVRDSWRLKHGPQIWSMYRPVQAR